MSEEGRSSNRMGLAFGYLVICAAVAILVAWYLGVWWYFFPIMMIAGGTYLLTMGFLASRVSASKGGPFFIYLLLWGGVLLIVGLEWILNDLYPGNLIFLVVLFLVFIGTVALLGYLMRRRS
jgi:hypothetical protein